jgi:sulfonate dioxygenase
MTTTRPAPIKSLEAYKHISPDSGCPTVVYPTYNPKIKGHVPPDPPLREFIPAKDRGLYADPEKKALFSVARPANLTESIGIISDKSRTLYFPGYADLVIEARN